MFTCKCLICGAEVRTELPERIIVCTECKKAIQFVKDEIAKVAQVPEHILTGEEGNDG